LIPTYNVEKYITEAIDSILLQTYKDLEVIIVDDGSTDNTFDILRILQLKDSRIHLYRNEKNMMITSTLNRALSYAKGEYIARMDGDDISMPDRIEKQVAYLISHPEVGLVGTHMIGIDEIGREINKTYMITDIAFIEKTSCLSCPVAHIWLARKSVYDTLNGYRELSGSEDYDLLMRMQTHGMKYINMDYIGYKVRLRSGNTASANGLRQRKVARYVIKLFKERRRYGNDSFISEHFQKEVQSTRLMELLHTNSAMLLNYAIRYKSQRRYLSFISLLLVALILSPYQIDYIAKKMILRVYVYYSSKGFI